MSQKEFDYKLSLALIGEPSTGKTNIFQRMRPFGAKYDWDNTIKPTMEIDFFIDSRQIEDQSIKLIIWDMGAGLRWIRETFYKQVHGFLVVYDITNRESFEKMTKWIEKIKHINRGKEMMPQIILIGNKCDLEEERKVSYEEGRNLAEEYGLKFFEVSAKTSENIDFVLKMFKREEVAKAKAKTKKEEDDNKNGRGRLWRINHQDHKESVQSVFRICAGLFSAYILWDIFILKK